MDGTKKWLALSDRTEQMDDVIHLTVDSVSNG